MHAYLRLTLLVIVSLGSALAVFSQTPNTNDPLVRVLQTKGILTEAEGKLEFDFEGDFPRANNRNITSIRSNQLSLRLAWVRIDRRFGENDSVFALFGQDWSPFVSSTLPTVQLTRAFLRPSLV